MKSYKIYVKNEEYYYLILKRLVELGYHDTGRIYHKTYQYLYISDRTTSIKIYDIWKALAGINSLPILCNFVDLYFIVKPFYFA